MKANILKQTIFFLCIMGILLSGLPAAVASDRTTEINSFITMLESNSLKTRIDAAKQITRSGLTDPGLFNMIQEKLLTGSTQNLGNSKHVDEMSWMCKALGASGMTKYKSTLTEVLEKSTSEKLKRYAAKSLRNL